VSSRGYSPIRIPPKPVQGEEKEEREEEEREEEAAGEEEEGEQFSTRRPAPSYPLGAIVWWAKVGARIQAGGIPMGYLPVI
jgi:hypothetical protein